MAVLIDQTYGWKSFAEGEIVRCLSCGGTAFGKVLPRSVTWVCPKPRLEIPISGGKQLECRKCNGLYWEYTMEAAIGTEPPRFR